MLAAVKIRSDLADTRVQLVFADEYGMDGNHFTALWDRIGAWAPRRLVLDPWRSGECRESELKRASGTLAHGIVGTAIHSVNAGASLLSAMTVKHQ